MNEIKKKVLIIEDDQSQRKILRDSIEQEGFIVKTAVDGEDGVAKFKEFDPELILLDILLPKQNGLKVLEDIRATEKGKNVKVVIFSNVKTMDSISKSVEYGARIYYIKSNTSLHEIIKVVKEEIKSEH